MGEKLEIGSQEGISKRAKKKVGRKPLYTNWLTVEGLTQVKEWAEGGQINKQIANNMGINIATLYEWQDRFPKFADALKSGKKVIDGQVENSLLKRALGYQYEEETWGKNHKGEMMITKRVVKWQAPDVTAQIFWLKNRQPERWRDRVEVKNEHEGTIIVEMGDMEKWSD